MLTRKAKQQVVQNFNYQFQSCGTSLDFNQLKLKPVKLTFELNYTSAS